MLLDSLSEALAPHVLHGDKEIAAGFVDVVNRGDVGMLDRSGGASFLNETLLPFFVGGKFFRKELERHLALELGVLGEVDLAHASLADLFEDLVMRNRRSDHLHFGDSYFI